jgi:hypothetical protein
VRFAIVLLLLAPAAFAQDLFPRFSLTGGTSPGRFDTNVRIDPEASGETGTLISFERDLGLDDSRTLRRFGLQWRPFRKHELALNYFSAPRNGVQQIDRQITFHNQVYPVNALVTTRFDLDYASATYTYWARRSDRDGLGITLGIASLSVDALVRAQRPDVTVTITESANTDVPVALAGVQSRLSLTNRLHAEGSVSTLPRVTIEGSSGTALTANARLEFRPLRWLGVGVAYDYFRLDVDVAQADLRGALNMRIRGPEAYARLAF